MAVRRLAIILIVVVAALYASSHWRGFSGIVPRQLVPSPHVRYSAVQHVRRAFGSEAAAAWIIAAQSALDRPHMAQAPFAADGTLSGTAAQAWRFSVRRGHRIVVDLAYSDPPAFIDLFRGDGAYRRGERGEWVVTSPVRRRPRWGTAASRPARTRLQRRVPVEDRSRRFVDISRLRRPPRAVASTFGVGRDSGRRRHAGVDIFAPRGYGRPRRRRRVGQGIDDQYTRRKSRVDLGPPCGG